MNRRALAVSVVTLLMHAGGVAEPLTRTWTARWISGPDAPPFDYGVRSTMGPGR